MEQFWTSFVSTLASICDDTPHNRVIAGLYIKHPAHPHARAPLCYLFASLLVFTSRYHMSTQAHNATVAAVLAWSTSYERPSRNWSVAKPPLPARCRLLR